MGGWRALYAIIAALILVYFLNTYFRWLDVAAPDPIAAGVLFLVALYLLFAAGSRERALWNSVRGEDGRASTSKFQVALWTLVVVFAYAALTAARWQAGEFGTLPDLPESVLAALGISAGTAVTAAAVTAGNVNAAKEVKVPALGQGISPIFKSDDGRLDLAKIQLLAWTALALTVFLGQVLVQLRAPQVTASLPDIDPTLMVLTGLGSATYVGRKLVTSSRPLLINRSPASISLAAADAARTITVTGSGFGTPGTAQLALAGMALDVPSTAWTDTSVSAVVPVTRPDGAQWARDTPLDVAVLTATGASQNRLTLVITA